MELIKLYPSLGLLIALIITSQCFNNLNSFGWRFPFVFLFILTFSSFLLSSLMALFNAPKYDWNQRTSARKVFFFLLDQSLSAVLYTQSIPFSVYLIFHQASAFITSAKEAWTIQHSYAPLGLTTLTTIGAIISASKVSNLSFFLLVLKACVRGINHHKFGDAFTIEEHHQNCVILTPIFANQTVIFHRN